MADYTFFTNPMSRGQIARWALHEAGATYDQVIISYTEPKPEAFLAANPMGAAHADPSWRGRCRLTECAAICAYLAEAHPAAAGSHGRGTRQLLPLAVLRGGPGAGNHRPRLRFRARREAGSLLRFRQFRSMVEALAGHFASHDFVSDRATMADVYVGSQVLWGLMFKTLPQNDSFAAYAARLMERPAYKEAKAIDNAMMPPKDAA
jgi:glutathione S-transferase